jgi:hypothetical protein
MAKIRRSRTDGPETWIDPRRPYDWDQPSDDLGLGLDWYKPIDVVERAFWRGVVIGAIAEAVVFLLIFGIFLWW